MRNWLGRGMRAAQSAADRADLWPAGALAWLVFIGWLPLLLVIAPPDAEGLEAFGVSLYLAESFPVNVALLAGGLVVGFAAACLLASAAELVIHDAMAPGDRHALSATRTLSAFAVVLVCSVPVVAALGLVLLSGFAVAPSEYMSAELGTPVLLRILLRLVPQLVILAAALMAAQAIAGTALRIGFANRGRPATAALSAAVRLIRRRAPGLVGIAAVGLIVDTLIVAIEYGILRVLWQPIGLGLGDGLESRPETILLLLGFIAVWLGLLLAAGALHVAISIWWAAEVGSGREASAPMAGAPPAAAMGPLADRESGGAH